MSLKLNLKELPNIKINKIDNFVDEVLDIPSSKSLSIRALLLASFSDGVSIIRNVLDSDDTNNCLNALKSLNIKIKQVGSRDFEIIGCGGNINLESDIEVFVGSSGITSRFLVALLSVSNFHHKITINCTPQLQKRPIKVLTDALLKINANIEYRNNDGFLPLTIKQRNLSVENNIDNIIEISGRDSSQYVSSILMLAPLIALKVKPIDIDSDEHPYIQMALQTMKDFGIKWKERDDVYIFEKQKYKATDFTIEIDFNTANYFFSIACITGGKIEINNINKNTLQPGLLFLSILEKLGCTIEYKTSSIIVKGGDIHGGFDIDMFKIAEMTITLSVLAIFADAPIKITGVSHIRKHETDRIHAIYNELTKLNVKCDEFDDGIKIYPTSTSSLKSVNIDTYDDHRIAMSFALLGLKNGIILDNPNCVSKTCPTFFNLLETIGVKLDY
jgi:3-phosphoshikimate 1-carboxyvinyltransferase